MKNGSNPFKNAELCTQCGYCLPACPTYRVENNELHAPRGRVSILLALQSSELTVEEAASALDHCLVCRACHSACPAGVRPAKLALTLRAMRPSRPTFFGAWLRYICKSHRLTAGLSLFLSFYQHSGLPWLVRRFGLLRPFPTLAQWASFMPRHADNKREKTAPLFQPVKPLGHTAGNAPNPAVQNIGLLCGCLARLFFPGVAPSAAQLLASLGFNVVILEKFGCCGAPFRESGHRKAFLDQARRTLDAFIAAGSLDAVVCDSSVCAVTAHSYARALANDAVYGAVAQTFSAKTETLSQFLAKQAVFTTKDPGLGSLTYHDHCQTYHGLGILTEPRALLAALPVTYHELPYRAHASRHECCGTGGHYRLHHPERSQKMMHHKLVAIRKSGADTVVGENPGCLLNMASALEQTHATVQVRHLAEVLWAARSHTTIQ